MLKTSYIKQLSDGKWRVLSEKGKNLGTYSNKNQAEERLKQIEMFKHMKRRKKKLSEFYQAIEMKKTAEEYRTLYHISTRGPALPRQKMKTKPFIYDFEKNVKPISHAGPLYRERPWLKEPIKSAVFLSDTPFNIMYHHGVQGVVHVYKVAESLIKEAGGIHMYDGAREIIFSEELWEEGKKDGRITYRGVMRQQKADDKQKNFKGHWMGMHPDERTRNEDENRRFFMFWRNALFNNPKFAKSLLTEAEKEKILNWCDNLIKNPDQKLFATFTLKNGDPEAKRQFIEKTMKVREILKSE